MDKKPLLTMLATTAIAVGAALSVPTAELSAATRGAKGASPVAARSSAKAAQPVKPNGIYIVRMAGEPVASYNGRIKGYAATRPAPGSKIDLTSASTVAYRDYLRSRQDAAVAKVGGRTVYNYDLAFNGFAAELT